MVPRRTCSTPAPLLLTLALFAAGCNTEGPQGPPGEEGPAGPASSTAGSITGTVTDDGGQPIEGAVVVTSPLGLEAFTDPSGVFALSDLGVGVYDVQASAEGYTSAVHAAVPVAADTATEVTFGLADAQGAAAVTVTVSTSSGQPLAGATVEVSDGSTGLTADDGTTAFTGVPAGTWDIAITPPDPAAFFGRTYPDVVVDPTVNTQLVATLSGRPGADAFELGSGFCVACHPGRSITHGNSAHGGGYSSDPEGSLQEAFEDGTAFWLEVEGGAQVVANLTMDGEQPVLELQPLGELSPEVYPVSAVVGRTPGARVLLTEMAAGRYVLPVAWMEGSGEYEGYPGVTEGPVPYETAHWFDDDGDFLDDAVTGIVDPQHSWEQQCIGCHETGFALGQQANGEVTSWWPADPSEFSAEPGIGCERCHGPGSNHTDAPMDTRADWIVTPANLDRDAVEPLCGQCHSARTATASGFDHALPFPYADSGPYAIGEDLDDYGASSPSTWSNGLASHGAQEADSLATSLHATNAEQPLTCLDCHDAHGSLAADDGTPIAAQLLEDPRDNGLCLGCHQALDFATEDDVREHTRHVTYSPGAEYAKGRCTGCHMVEGATVLGWDTETGGGTIADHGFAPVPPQDSVDAFDAAGVTELDVGRFPPNSCVICHQRGAWIKEEYYGDPTGYIGPGGDPTQRLTHTNLQLYYESMF